MMTIQRVIGGRCRGEAGKEGRDGGLVVMGRAFCWGGSVDRGCGGERASGGRWWCLCRWERKVWKGVR